MLTNIEMVNSLYTQIAYLREGVPRQKKWDFSPRWQKHKKVPIYYNLLLIASLKSSLVDLIVLFHLFLSCCHYNIYLQKGKN